MVKEITARIDTSSNKTMETASAIDTTTIQIESKIKKEIVSFVFFSFFVGRAELVPSSIIYEKDKYRKIANFYF